MALNIGFIGVGGISEVHLRNITGMDDARVAAMYDVNPQRLNEMARKYDAVGYTDLNQMLDSEKLDGVYICVPPFAHGEPELTVIERGLPMLVEKPISVAHEPADQILKAIQEKQLLTSVGYHWRYSRASNIAKATLAGETPGMVLGYWLGGMPMVGWWRQMDKSGGQMVEQTTHIVDLARYLLGDVKEVYAVYAQREMQSLVDGVSVPDVGSITLRFQSGVVGTISNTCLLNQGYTVGLHVLTRNVILEVDSDSVTERRALETTIHRNQTNPYYEEDVAFLKAIRTSDPTCIHSSYQDAYETQRVTAAANESAETGKPVLL
ncbi:Gfo/Idh/MocA family protein [Alicyclobacillus fodiniaquatilis]|uniref:Gfo/Idh/MocA family protein n=1 Tax=Alicyclobacillus fodiniaquatilis TaxID=1661150 RepID=A0ABW4JMW1_9BACL